MPQRQNQRIEASLTICEEKRLYTVLRGPGERNEPESPKKAADEERAEKSSDQAAEQQMEVA
jgi:hypothetical protein